MAGTDQPLNNPFCREKSLYPMLPQFTGEYNTISGVVDLYHFSGKTVSFGAAGNATIVTFMGMCSKGELIINVRNNN